MEYNMYPKRINAAAFLPERERPLILKRFGILVPEVSIETYVQSLLVGPANLAYKGIIWLREVGFAPYDLQLMRLASYLLLHSAIK
jgi:hypothetical protein